MLTQEYRPGVGWVTEDAAFQQYQDPAGSAAGWWSLMQNPMYKDVLNAPDLQTAIGAIGRSPYATDPAYGAKVGRMTPSTPEQQAFYEARVGDLLAAGANPTMAHLGARQSALETGWGRSAPGSNYFGIKAPQRPAAGFQNTMVAQAGRPDIEQGLTAEIPRMGAQQPQQQAPGMAMPPQPQQPPGFLDRLSGAMQNPLFLTGASILANNTGNYGAAAPAIGRGLMGGQAMAGAMQEDALNQQMKRMQMAQAQRQMAIEEQRAGYVDQWLSTQDPERQQLARMLGPDKFVELMLQQTQPVKPTDDIREFQLAKQQGYPGSFLDYQKEIKGASATQVSLNTGEKAEDKALAEYGIKQLDQAQQQLEALRPKLGTIEVMDQLLDGINTGKAQPLITDIKGWADALGIAVPGIEKLAPAQAFNALANQMTLQARSTANGTGMPGAMSDQDRKFLQQMVPGLEKQKLTNRVLLDVMRKLATREQEVATIKVNYFNKYGTMRPTTDPQTGQKVSLTEALQQFTNSAPLFNPDYVKQALGGF